MNDTTIVATRDGLLYVKEGDNLVVSEAYPLTRILGDKVISIEDGKVNVIPVNGIKA